MKFHLALAVLFLFLSYSTISTQTMSSFYQDKNEIFAFINVNVIPMDREVVLKNQTVVVSNGLITGIGPTNKIKIPTKAVRINGRGKYLIPGLTDAHVHLYSTTEMPLYVANGVTTIFDLNGRPAFLQWRKRIADGDLFGPTIYTCGPTFSTIRTPDAAVNEVERQFNEGYDGIKIYNQVSKEEYPALVSAAKNHNMILVGHIARLPGFEATMKAGQSIAHAEEYLYTFFNESTNPSGLKINLDESRIPEAVSTTRKSGGALIPTLVTYENIIKQAADLDNFLKNPDLKYIAKPQLEKLQASRNMYKNRFTPEQYPRLRQSLEFQKKLVKALHEAGVPIIAGTDSLGVGTIAGFSLHQELQNFVSIGFSPYESLKTATVNSAEFLKSLDKFGTVTVGKRADLLLLNGNPLEDIKNTSNLAGVMHQGKWIPKPKLHELLENLITDYKSEIVTVNKLLNEKPKEALKYLNENDPFGQLVVEIVENILIQKGFDGLKATIQGIDQNAPNSLLTKEFSINQLGYQFVNAKKLKHAIEVFKLNVDLYPQSSNAYSNLAEVYLTIEDKENAIKNFKKSLELNPQNNKALENLKKLQQ